MTFQLTKEQEMLVKLVQEFSVNDAVVEGSHMAKAISHRSMKKL